VMDTPEFYTPIINANGERAGFLMVESDGTVSGKIESEVVRVGIEKVLSSRFADGVVIMAHLVPASRPPKLIEVVKRPSTLDIAVPGYIPRRTD
jgi:hypothetical protein